MSITKFHITVSGSSATETCVLKQLIVAEFTHSAGSEFHASMTVLGCYCYCWHDAYTSQGPNFENLVKLGPRLASEALCSLGSGR